jgi:hemolysin III
MNINRSNILLEEKWNAYSHGLGVVLSLIGGIWLLKISRDNQLFPLIIYACSLVLLFAASTVYHSVYKPAIKFKLRKLDHISIYLLIAGTYTPICLSILKPSKGLFLLSIVWSIAIVGTILKLRFTGKYEVISLVLYGIMGWLVVIDFDFILQNDIVDFTYLALGGIFYTLGILFYAIKRIPYNHFIWHIFVLIGAACHWYFIYREVVLNF